MKKHNLREFELSQAYLFFWDKLERANYFLEQIIDTAEEELDSRLVQELLKAPVNDGGQWDMFTNLVAKYGLVCPPMTAKFVFFIDSIRFRKFSILTPITR